MVISEIDVVKVYLGNSLLFDFLIYAVLFVGLCHLVLRKHFGGRTGRVVSLVLGLALAIGLSVFEEQRGFRIGSFGYLAFALLVLTLLILIYNFFVFAQGLPFVKSSAAQGFARFSPFGKREKDLRSEAAQIKGGLRSLIAREKRVTRDMLRDLKQIRRDVQRYAGDPSVKKELGVLFFRLRDRQRILMQSVDRFYRLNRGLEREDLEILRVDGEVFKRVPRHLQRMVLKNLASDRFRIALERRIDALVREVSEWNSRLSSLVNDSIQALRKRNVERAEQILAEAIKVEKHSKKLVKQIGVLEKWLFRNVRSAMQRAKKLRFVASKG